MKIKGTEIKREVYDIRKDLITNEIISSMYWRQKEEDLILKNQMSN